MEAIKRKHGGPKKVPFLEQKVIVYGMVKRKYAKEVHDIIKELVKPYR